MNEKLEKKIVDVPNVEAFYALVENGETVLDCGDCDVYFTANGMRRYGDHSCPACGSINVGMFNKDEA